MKNILIVGIIFAGLVGCKMIEHSHKPGAPHYFKSGVTYQGYRPTGELSQVEADQLGLQGYAYYIAYFDSEGKPTNILKVFNGDTNSIFQAESRNE